MLYSRYRLTADHAGAGVVLEVACGAGQGLGYLSRHASFVVGGDITAPLVSRAQAHYGGVVPLAQFDAEALPFKSATFDLVALHEAVYYLRSATQFVEEAHRVLKPSGRLIVTTINPDWQDFNPSPFSTTYFTAPMLHGMLSERFHHVEMFGSFPATSDGRQSAFVSVLKRTAVRLRLIPRTMRGKRLLKRVFLGPLVTVPFEVTSATGPYGPAISIRGDQNERGFKVIYAIARK